jgi:hypothetical protein
MKQIKDLRQKADDLRDKVARFGADQDIEAPTYGTEQDQREQVAQWMQAHRDILKEILRLRVAIQRTNLATPVEIELDGHRVTKSIAEWIHRRRDLAALEAEPYQRASARAGQIRSGHIETTSGERREVQVRRYFAQAEYDARIEALRSEPLKIDGTLEVVNAVTDLIES